MTGRSRISSIVQRVGDLTIKVASTGCHCGGECKCDACSKAESEQSELRKIAEKH